MEEKLKRCPFCGRNAAVNLLRAILRTDGKILEQ